MLFAQKKIVIDFENDFKPEYTVMKGRKKYLSSLKKEAKVSMAGAHELRDLHGPLDQWFEQMGQPTQGYSQKLREMNKWFTKYNNDPESPGSVYYMEVCIIWKCVLYIASKPRI